MNAAQRNHHAALLKAAGYEDAPALTATSSDGDIPQGRELHLGWLAGTVMTGLTSVLLMAAALYVSFQGRGSFATAVSALIPEKPVVAATSLNRKTDRIKPITHTRSERETVVAAIREKIDGRTMIRKQPFVRIEATLATAATALSDDIPKYDPIALLNASRPIDQKTENVSTDIYGTDIEGEVAVKTTPLALTTPPKTEIDDAEAASFVRDAVLGAYSGSGDAAYLAYANTDQNVRDLGTVPDDGISGISGVAENVTVVPKSDPSTDKGLGRTERIVTIREAESLKDALIKNGFTAPMIAAIVSTLHNVYPDPVLPEGARLRILMGPARNNSDSVIPYRLSIYVHDKHAATVALTDQGRYVLALAPPPITFPKDDTEEVNVANLPSIYRSIWETGRKNDLKDKVIERIVAMYAYDMDLTKKVKPGDTIKLLESAPDAKGDQELLYVNLIINGVSHKFYRYRTDDGVVDYYDPNGQTGKRFLNRRPVQGGGRISSRFGWRYHPIFHTRKLHTGVDLAAPYGTPIYAAGDGVIELARWVSGYGRMVEIQHANGYSTRYGHMSRFATIDAPGVHVRQGQIIGYVGSTGVSTGNHVHFEIRINNVPVDPLSVKLPRDKSLPTKYDVAFDKTMAQIDDLMKREPSAPITVASAN